MKTTLNPLVLAIAASIPTQALAQDESSRVLEEVIVTAQKRSESLQDVPISIAVMSQEAIEKTGVRQMRELVEFVPNVTMSSGNDNSSAVRIRGVGASTRNIGFDTRVGMYVDGIYLGQSPAQNVDILDLERVEISRGPQGTLYGKNTVAGAINMITNKPDQEFMTELRGEYGNLDSYRVSAIVNLPINERWSSRFSVSDNHRDGYVDNITTGTEHNERDGTSLRGQLRYSGENFDLNIAGDYLESERTSFFGEAVTDWSGSVSPDPLAPRELEISNNVDNYEERTIWGLSATADIDLNSDYALRSITAYRDTDSRRIQDSDHSATDLLSVDYPDEYEQWSQELQLLSPGDDRLAYVLGLYYYNEASTTNRAPVVGTQLDVLLTAIGNPLAPFGPEFAGASVGTFGDVDTESWAAYINGTYDITDNLVLGFGARYTWEEKSIDYAIVGDVVDLGFAQIPGAAIFGVAIGPVVDGQTVAPYKDSNDYTDFSPTVSLTYSFNESLNLYVKYSSAFKSGGYNADFVPQEVYDNGIDFDKETVDAYELGLKGSLLDESLRFSLIAFQMDFEDYQLNQFVDLGNNLSAITIRNAAEVQSRGLELEATWLPTTSLMLQGSVGTSDATFESFPGGGSARNPDGLGADLSGNTLPEAPELTAALAGQHNFPLPNIDAELVTRVDWTYTDEYYTSEDNVKFSTPGGSIPFGIVDSYSILNARIGIEAAGHWSVYLWGRNLLDEEYSSGNGSDFFGTIVDFPSDPRTYGVEVSYIFD